jgi:beta-glucanase (GH16 family)
MRAVGGAVQNTPLFHDGGMMNCALTPNARNTINMKFLAIALAAILSLSAPAKAATFVPTTNPQNLFCPAPSPIHWVPAFTDNFSNSTGHPWSKWGGTPGGSKSNMGYNPANVYVQNGRMVIKLSKTPYLGRTYSGGGFDTRKFFNTTYGRVEAIMRSSGGSGQNPSALFWPTSNQWVAEIDYMESAGAKKEYTVTVHYFTPTHHWIYKTFPLLSVHTHFHSYAVEWTPTAVNFYVDCRFVQRVTTGVPRVQMKLGFGFSMSTGSNWVGPPDDSRLPSYFEIDALRAWTWL